ncbi:paeninodin family lasso peptide [Paenibacillus sp. LMG 31456]|uniref:Paeninodin family lasso peptide n=1 Tax=Paenibacillus foliorum TaxID=2654974 RepID=A0A972JY69_9BACL|nr:paeninodin family lasso peptide [Paenibacillus foliorum]NOU92241.1 paeninodin family lasso peptide [Paenibacillus foliorum]
MQKNDWTVPMLEALDIKQTMNGKSSKSNDGGQGGDDSDSSGS